jgi:two-component system CheB/CheR fusion protein
MLLTNADLFSPLNLQHRIFQKVRKMDRRERLLTLAQSRKEEAGMRSALNIRLLEEAFDAMPVAQIVVDSQSNLILANQLARSRFDIDSQDQGRPFQDLEISYRPLELRSPIKRVYKEGTSILFNDVIRTKSDGTIQYLDIEISLLQENPIAPLGVSITFNEVTRYHQLQEQLERSKQELETVNNQLQSRKDELETTHEELQSSHEELETANEELQSTNEELETTNEELQSINEELQTINDELGRKTIELNHSNAFLESIFASLQSAVIVVNRQFQIQTWNEAAQKLWGPKSDEVQNQSLFNLDIGLPVKRLREPLYQCLSGKQLSQEILIDALNNLGESIQCHLSFNPLKDGNKDMG